MSISGEMIVLKGNYGYIINIKINNSELIII